MMNKLTTAIALTGALVLVQACSLLTMAEQSGINSAVPSSAQSADQIHGDKHQQEHSTNSHSNAHDNHGKTSEPTSLAEARLISATNILANTTVPLAIHVQKSNGEAIQKFDVFQEKLMHLIVVSDDLQFFNHIHPDYKKNGHFEFAINFPQSGGYTIFSDYKPTQSQEQISILKTWVLGTSAAAPLVDFTRIKTFDKNKVELAISGNEATDQTEINTDQEVMLTFNLKDVATNQAISDLQPYLGEQGHLVIIKQSPELTSADYIHAHALRNNALGKVSFVAKFPQAGKYKMWGQFNRGGKIITADFWIDVK